MFTGIITDIATIEKLERKAKDVTLTLASKYEIAGIDIGASISCNGACLTVVEKQNKSGKKPMP